MNAARLVMPAIRWQADGGFAVTEALAVAALEGGAGGAIVFGGHPDAVAALTARLRAAVDHPLLIAADLERGAGQQLSGLTEFPPPAALAALRDPEAVRTAARVTAREALEVGINWVLAPVADLDLLPDNPIVQTRAFGGEPAATAEAVRAWVQACQAEGALACAKHYPGHGRTTLDSHSTLPVVAASADDLAATDLVPFRAAIEGGVASIMTAHVAFPALDPGGSPATFSSTILGELRHQHGFDGLVVSDALIMAGARQGREEPVAAEAALYAGVDVLLYPGDPLAVMRHLVERAEADETVAELVAGAVGRREAALRRTGSTPKSRGQSGEGRVLFERLLEQGMVRGTHPALRQPIDLVVVDDDTDGDYPASSHEGVALQLRARGAAVGAGGSRVVLVFSEPRAGKGRAHLGDAAVAQVQREAGADLVVLFGHPRLVAQLPGTSPVLLAWHRQVAMQAAVGDYLVRRATT